MELVNCCDLAIAAEDAQFARIEQRLGFAGASAELTLSIIHIGLKRTLGLMLTGDTIDGKEAERLGMINKAVPADQLEEEVNKVAEKICLLPRDGIALGKSIRHLTYDALQLTTGFTRSYVGHSFATNLRWEPDEYNFFKERRDKGAKEGFHGRDDRYEKT